MDVLLVKKPYEVSYSGNPMPFIFTLYPFGDSQRTQDYKLLVNVLLDDADTGNFQTVYTQVFFPDFNGNIQLDVSTIIDAYLTFYTPKISLPAPVAATGQRKKYKISYQIQLADTLVSDSVISEVFYAIKGGLSYEQWNPLSFFQQNIISNAQPLHYATETEKISLEQKLFFYWIYPYADNLIQLINFTFYFNDGTSATYPLPTTIQIAKWSICVCPAGLTQIGYTIPAGKMVVKYRINVTNSDGVLIALSSFYTIDYRSFYNTYQLYYRNSLGGFASLRLRGEVDLAADYNYTQSLRVTPASYYSNQILLPQTIQEKNEETYKVTGDTGFISKDAVNNLRDLLLSPQVFELINNKYYPAIIIGKSVKLYTNKDSLFSLQLQWQYAFVNGYFTPAGTVVDVNDCPAVEKFVVIQINKNTLQLFWSLVIPYDTIKVAVIATATKNYVFSGNTGNVLLTFDNPALPGETADISITAQTVCDVDSFGPITTFPLTVYSNSLPVAVDNTVSIASGYNTSITLPGNILYNDYDPDGDPIECVVNAGGTHAGGTFTLASDGTVTYLPPSSVFTGTDYFEYQVCESADPSNVSNTARVYIHIGGVAVVYVRLSVLETVIGTVGSFTVTGHYILKFFSDASCTIPIDVTALSLSCNVKKTEVVNSVSTESTSSYSCAGMSTTIYTGTIYHTEGSSNYALSMQLLPGTGYTPVL